MTSAAPFDDFILQSIFLYLHNANDRQSVAYVCRRWRRNCAFVAPLSSLDYWIYERNEHLCNRLFDALEERLGFVPIPHYAVRMAIMLRLHSTVKRFSTLNVAPDDSAQLWNFSALLRSRHNRETRSTNAMFDILYAHPIFEKNRYVLLDFALSYNHPYVVKRLLKDGVYSCKTDTYCWFTVSFYRYAICRGNAKLCQLYVNDYRFNVAKCNEFFCHICDRGYTAVVRMFLKQRPELDVNFNGGSPLMLAVRYSHRKVVLLLLQDKRLHVSNAADLFANCSSPYIRLALASYFAH